MYRTMKLEFVKVIFNNDMLLLINYCSVQTSNIKSKLH